MRPKRYIPTVAVALLASTAPAMAHPPFEKIVSIASERPAIPLTARLDVPAGKTLIWRSQRLTGAVTRMSLVVNGQAMDYRLAPRTNSCVGYSYGAGVALRLTDCRTGRRVPYLRARAVNASLKPAHLILRFWTS